MIYAIGDLHLSIKSEKPMDIFGAQWTNHYEKIKYDWCKTVKPDDCVLIPGDISWAMTINEAMEDLKWIDLLPGQKFLIKGNHDYWWSSINKLNNMFESMHFIQNNYFKYQEYAICGTRGWVCPNTYKFTTQDEKIYKREGNRLENSLKMAKQDGHIKIIAMLHYSPTNDLFEPSIFTEILETYKVEKLIYGHLHGKESYDYGLKGIYRGVDYQLASCDYLGFKLLKL